MFVYCLLKRPGLNIKQLTESRRRARRSGARRANGDDVRRARLHAPKSISNVYFFSPLYYLLVTSDADYLRIVFVSYKPHACNAGSFKLPLSTFPALAFLQNTKRIADH